MNNQELTLQLDKVQSGPSLAKGSEDSTGAENASITLICNC